MSARWQDQVALAVEALDGIGLTSRASILAQATDLDGAVREIEHTFLGLADLCEWDRHLGTEGVSEEAHGSVVAVMGVMNDVIAELTIIARRAA